MRAPVSWLREYVEGAPVTTGREVAASLVRLGLEEEGLHGGDITGPLVVGRVLEFVEEPQKNGKTIRWCQVDVGQHGQRVTEGKAQEVVCGALNFDVGDLVVVVLPGAVLPGGMGIGARKTYGHVSNGMICSAQELGLDGVGADGSQAADGIVVLQSLLGEEASAKLTPGDDAIELLGLGDEVVEVTVTPDRGYCLSMRGIAREYAHATGGTLRDPAAVTTAPPNTSGYVVQLADEAPLNGRAGCDRYVARVVRGVNASATSPPWMQRRLTQMGMRPLSLAVDVTNYVMLALGQPLHAFDVSTLQGPIVVRRAKAGETLRTLDGVNRALYPEDLLITEGGAAVLAIAGVMGGATSEVGASTTDVLVEAAHFDPTSVARSSRRHKLTTEASKRFERGVDPDITDAAAQLAVDLLVEFGGGVADGGVTDVDHRPPRARIEIDPSLPARLVGLPYTREEVIATLREIGCDVREDVEPGSDPASSVLSVLPPSWRPDLRNGPDFAEEVVRLRGYDQVPAVLPQAGSGRGLTHGQRVRRILANTLAGQGFVEVLTYPFVSAQRHDELGLEADDPRRNAVRIANPLSEEAPLMRTSVLSTLVEALRRNVSRGQRDVAIFEVGLVACPVGEPSAAPVPGTKERPDEATLGQIMAAVPPQPRRVAFALTGDADPAGWWGPGRPADWTDVVGAARAVASALTVRLVLTADDIAPWHPGRCARLELADGTLVGHAGELHPKVVSVLGLPPGTCAGELDVDVLTAASDVLVQARELSTYPVAQSDVALVVDEQVPAAAVESALRLGAGEMLESVSLMDIYRGDQVGAGRKSLAYRLVFRAPERTLTTKEVNGLRDQAIAAAATAVGATQRGA